MEWCAWMFAVGVHCFFGAVEVEEGKPKKRRKPKMVAYRDTSLTIMIKETATRAKPSQSQ